jgi:hypothetical protein
MLGTEPPSFCPHAVPLQMFVCTGIYCSVAGVIPQSLPNSGSCIVSESTLTSQVRTVREVMCAWTSVSLQPGRWMCWYWSAYVAAANT